ncbi:MAG: phosphatidylglycerol lysyltransferase domain-containing protein [Synergistaceae bacterium]|nr:phosphatidylglycerol lysyltransferase domain-containing protein [Synergistaceae bacterium]
MQQTENLQQIFDKNFIADYKKLHEKMMPLSANFSFFCSWRRTKTDGQKIVYDTSLNMFVFLPQEGLPQFPPLADYNVVNWDEYFNKYFYGRKQISFVTVPEALLKVWRNKFSTSLHAEENRDLAEYLYDAVPFSSLSGRKYDKKRNHFNFLTKHFEYSYLPLTPDLVPQVKQFQKNWLEKQMDMETIKGHFLPKEDVLIDYMLSNWSFFCPKYLQGSVILINDEVVAYTIGEIVGSSIIIHIEKANSKIHGLYQGISKDFLTQMLLEHPEIKIVNREEDMGDAGLRHAKMSYHPDGFSKNYNVQIKL